MVPLDLYDTLEITEAPEFSFTCSEPALQNDDNLVVRAARAIAPNVARAIHLEKVIPTQAGLGGGSSDAGAVLLAAMQGAFGDLPPVDWVKVARTLGSDVPFFLAQSGALVEGTGERVTALGSLPPWHVLVVKPPIAISTASAFAELDRHARKSRPRSDSASLHMVEALQAGNFTRVKALMQNDFHDVIATSTEATSMMLSGSGSALFALAQTEAEIAELDDKIDVPPTYTKFRTRLRNSEAWRA
jgi:4-diphosphocytidyl-2-C-methyl-D-erythritol kinase